MSKITFRADDDLIRQLEEFDASKSEVLREALREYLEESDGTSNLRHTGDPETLDDILVERVDDLIERRIERSYTPRKPRDVNVNITLDGDPEAASVDGGTRRKTPGPEPETASDEEETTCKQCGEDLSQSAVYCSNCGEKASHRVFCDCGDELRSDWAFCPSCGRRTPAADVLDSS